MVRSQQLVEDILAELKTGAKVSEIAKKFGKSPMLIYSICHCIGYSIRKLRAEQRGDSPEKIRRFPRVYRPSERDLDIITMRRAGFMLAAIGNKYNISRERVRQVILKYNQNNPDNPVSNKVPRAAKQPDPKLIERRKVVAKLRRKGMSQIEIGTQLGISAAVVKQDLDRYNETAKKPIKRFVVVRRKLSSEDRKKIVSACKKGVLARVLAEKYGVSVGRICHLSRRAGIPDRRHRSRSSVCNVSRKALLRKYSEGKPIEKIAEQYGISVSAVRAICYKAGVYRTVKTAGKKKTNSQ
ncbi:hypothetical protein FACS18942_06040 [Planctomycetales bacterium]|nr:hypothetical protein FACS18942_06040 [Planctomycetales bacterium]